jgi:general secretion pathway protein E
MIDMGIEPFLLASSLRGVLAQRLVRCLCTACKTALPDGTQRARGCEACGMTGFSGRNGVFELLEIDSESRAIIHRRGAEAELRAQAQQLGMRSLQQDGARLIAAGVTSREELEHATRSE